MSIKFKLIAVVLIVAASIFIGFYFIYQKYYFSPLTKNNSQLQIENPKKEVKNTRLMGTQNRNHCPFCLYSLHVDENISGDRKSFCHGMMEPVGLTFKEEGIDKYGNKRQGEIMIVHQCRKCDKISINRVAGDDDANEILKVFENSLQNSLDFGKLNEIKLLKEEDRNEIKKQLFGK